MLPLSQSHLSCLDTCARRYEYVYFDSLSGPASYEQHVYTQWGSQFHLLMQQRALNLPIETLSEVAAELSASLSALQAAAPEVFEYLSGNIASNLSTFGQSEHRRTRTFNDYLLTVIYDLVVILEKGTQKQGLIFDWKTHQRPPHREQLRRDWQTRLYLYLLCETSELAPEEISMTYWFGRMTSGVNADKPAGPSCYKFSYSLAEHDQTRHELQRLTDQLSNLTHEIEAAEHYPKAAIEKGVCDRCPFNVRCDRRPPEQATRLTSTPHPQLLKTARQLGIPEIPEIPL